MTYRATTHPRLLLRAGELRKAAVRAAELEGYTVDQWIHEDRAGPQRGDPPYAGHARARNYIVNTVVELKHDLVMWMDADIVEYPADIIPQLDYVRGDGVAAPFVYLEGEGGVREEPARFYDTRGFIEGYHPTFSTWPYVRQEGPVVRLNSVGCCYLIPADVYRSGARYAPEPAYTEHWPVMQAAEEMGYTIVADRRIVAWHAHLPSYGEAWHTGRE